MKNGKYAAKIFFTRKRHYELCSNEYHKVQAVEAEREFDEKAIGSNSYMKPPIITGKTANLEKPAIVDEALKIFRKEAVNLKGMVKHRELPLACYSSWLIK